MKLSLFTTSLVIMVLSYACSSNEKGTKKSESTVEATPEPQQNTADNSDQWILEQLRKKYPDISHEDICIVRPSSFPNLALVGLFAHDRGCKGSQGYYGQHKGTLHNLAGKVLNDHGWSDRTKRTKLAMAYTREVISVWEAGVMDASTANFDKKEAYQFSPPSSTMEDGEVTVTCWIQEPAGMRPADSFYHLTVIYGNDGDMASLEKSNGFSVDY